MPCTAIIGPPRTGKTLLLTAIGETDFQKKRKIYSNYTLSFEHEKYDIDDLLAIATMEMDISPKTVLMQEASKWFDSRRSGRKENVLLSSFTGQSGKREIDIYYDDQFMTRIDRGLRDITDYSFLSSCIRDKDKNPVLFQYEMYYGYFVYPLNKTLQISAEKMVKYYDMYNTREPTKPLMKEEKV
jgi:hypothetical protein